MKDSRLKSVLIVASGADGHRQNYAVVLGRWFAQKGHSVALACGPAEHGLPASQSPILAQLLSKSGSVAFDLEKDAIEDPARFRARLTQLETDLNPAWTVLVNGEECVRALQGEWPRESKQRQRAAVFIYFSQEYPLDLRPYSDFGKLIPWLRQLRQRYRRRFFFRWEAGAKLGLDLILCMDEHVVTVLPHPRVRYLPDIYRAWGAEIASETPAIVGARLAYGRFLARHRGKDVLLYYGGRVLRRGYDTLLGLAQEHEDTVFVSVGPAAPTEKLPEVTGLVRKQLEAQGRLFELELPFMDVNPLVDDLFRSAHYVILPNRNWYGISASLLQAASYGCPVLVPDIGSVDATVRRYGIGLTYRHLDSQHLRQQFAELRRDLTRFRDRVQLFSHQVDEKAVFAALAAAFRAA